MAQGFDLERYDLVVGLDVVHAARRIDTALGQLQRLVAPGGLLCLLESVRPRRHLDLIWGFADGWWHFEDAELRRKSPLLGIAQWTAALTRGGFQEVAAWPGGAERASAEYGLILARRGRPPETPAAPDDAGSPADRLRRLGADVLMLQADVADRAQMQRALADIHAHFGRLDGVIHAAGIAGGGTIQVRTRDDSEREFAAKVDGCRVLAEVLGDTPLEAFILCSSMTSATGGFGQVAYSAACAFQDAFRRGARRMPARRAGHRDRLGPLAKPWHGGHAGDAAPRADRRRARRRHGQPTRRSTRSVASCPPARRAIIVSTRDFPALVEQSRSWQLGRIAEQMDRLAPVLHPRPHLAQDYVAPVGETEQLIAGIWQEELGIERVGTNDDFFALGGDSLIAIKLTSRLRKALPGAARRAHAVWRADHRGRWRGMSRRCSGPARARAGDRRGCRGGRAVRPLVEVMAALRAAEVRVWADGAQLRYQGPKGALTPALLGELRSRKDDILDLCRQVRSGPVHGAARAAPRDAELELSLAQHRLWLLDRMEGPGPTYNIALALHLRGALDAGALRQGCETLVRRHEALRTCFRAPRRDRPPGDRRRRSAAVVDGGPRTPAAEQQRLPEVRRQARDEALRPFDLGRAPLIRFVLWTAGPREAVLLMILHHIIADGRSIEILAEELGTAYRDHRLGRAPHLPDLPLQYSDFAWQQRRASSERLLQGQLDHWRERLAGLPPLLEVPTDRARPPVFSSAGATIAHRLDREPADRLRRLAQQSGATLYMALVAAVATLLARYTGRDDVPIACPATHRNRPELDRLVGFFINTLPLRVDLSGAPTFRDLLQHVRGIVGDAFRNQDVPFEKVVEALRVERDPSYPPLVQFSMVLRDAEKSCPSLPDLADRAVRVRATRSRASTSRSRCTHRTRASTSSGSTAAACSIRRPSSAWHAI